MTASELARVTTFVAVSPEDAFEVFTEEIDRWWRRGRRYRSMTSEDSELRFERVEGGRRLVEATGGELFEIGRVLEWQPGRLLCFEWRQRNFAADQVTHVEVRFEPAGDGTRVVLEHRGWDSLPAGHPARHGLRGPAFSDMIGLFWGDLATSYRALCSQRSRPHAR